MNDYGRLDASDGALWAEGRRELDLLVAGALESPEIKDELRALGIPAAEVARAVRDKPDVLASFRGRRNWLAPAREPGHTRVWWSRQRRWVDRLRPARGTVLALALVGGYLALLVAALPRMPLGGQLFALAGVAAVLRLAGWLMAADARLLRRTVRRARDPGGWELAFVHEVLEPELRQYLAEQREPIYGTELPVDRAHLTDDDQESPPVVTSVGRQLRRILSRPTSEAVAIAGPRGVGKTTTIHAIADGVFNEAYANPPLPVLTAAPSRYDARDFLLHLHSALCQRVIELTSAVLRLPPEKKRRPWLWLPVAVRALLLVGLWAGTMWLLRTDDPTVVWRLTTSADTVPLHTLVAAMRAAIALVLVLLAVTVNRLVARYLRRRRYPGLKRLRTEAFEHLRRIRFLQTYTSGWSGKVGLPAGADAGWNRSVQRAEQNLTHPEVVDNFRRFAERSATTLIRAGLVDRLVIAIDEVDKIAEPAQAHELVNDVKGIFGIPNCLFLVSVSEDAMSAFERRGIPVRDAFDSAFTQLVRMDNFTLAESRRWLSRRLLWVPEQFTYLLHCLSGGLPRELRRVTIELVDIVAEDERGDLGYVTGVLLDRELDRKARAFVAAARQFDDTDELSEYLADLATIPDARTPAEQVALAGKLAPGTTVTELRRVRWQSACFLLFCATMLEIFDDRLGEAGLGGDLESLARARVALAVDPQVSWRLVQSVRAAFSLGPRDA